MLSLNWVCQTDTKSVFVGLVRQLVRPNRQAVWLVGRVTVDTRNAPLGKFRFSFWGSN